MADTADAVACPFCGQSYAQEWAQMLTLHIESEHPDDGVDHVPAGGMSGVFPTSWAMNRLGDRIGRGSSSNTEALIKAGKSIADNEIEQAADDDCVICPESDCEEPILLIDLDEHLELHEATRSVSLDGEARSSSGTKHGSSTSSRDTSTCQRRRKRSHREQHIDDNVQLNGEEQPRVWLRRRAVKRSTQDDRMSKANTRSQASSSKADRIALGPYATEKSMPPDLYARLAAGPKTIRERTIGLDGRLHTRARLENHTSNLIEALAHLSAADLTVETAYFCHPAVQHIQNAKGEGGFCGYRNVQMQMTWILGTEARGWEGLGTNSTSANVEGLLGGGHKGESLIKPPTIIGMQDWIETAWDMGINSQGREEVGRLRGTRKWIGTSEASAIYQLLDIDHEVWQCSDGSSSATSSTSSASRSGGQRAHRILFQHVGEYFSRYDRLYVTAQTPTSPPAPSQKVIRTSLPPIYLQQPGHSLTIVGFERRKSGHCNLLVFDCMYAVPKTVLTLANDISRQNHTAGSDETSGPRGKLSKSRREPQLPSRDLITKSMDVFRRDGRRLHRYKEFETLILRNI